MNVYPEYNSLKKTIKDFRKKDISQTFDNIKAFKSFYIDSDESEETQKLLNENFINYLNQLIEKIESDSNITLPTPQAWKSYVQYYTHVPKSIKYRIDKVLRDIEKYGLVQINSYYVGFTKDEENKIKSQHILSTEETVIYMGILYSISKTIYGDNAFDKLPDLLESNHPVFEATKNSKIKELLKLDGIYKIKDLIYNPYIIRELGVFYKEKFKEKLTSKEIKKLIKSNSDQVIEEMFINYQNRTKGNKIIDAYYDFILFYTLGFNIKSFSNYNGNKDYDYTPVIWSKTFNNSIRLLENYETTNRSSKLNLDNNKIIQELFEGVDNIPSLLNNFSIDQIPDEVFQEYLNEVVQTRDIPDDDIADIYE